MSSGEAIAHIVFVALLSLMLGVVWIADALNRGDSAAVLEGLIAFLPLIFAAAAIRHIWRASSDE